ncbi:MAG: ester cyclase [Flavobacteriales bacterium]|nr:ester cyclase [Flavobacteriales bacterium]
METIKLNLSNYTKSHWTQEELRNAELALDFVQQLMNNHNFEHIQKEFGNQPYVQHNRSMTDGIGGVLSTVKNLVKRSPEYAYDVKNINVDGDQVTFHSHVTLSAKHRGNPDKGFNIMDTWRVENGQLAEHWDAIQPIDMLMRLYFLLAGGKVANENTLF